MVVAASPQTSCGAGYPRHDLLLQGGKHEQVSSSGDAFSYTDDNRLKLNDFKEMMEMSDYLNKQNLVERLPPMPTSVTACSAAELAHREIA